MTRKPIDRRTFLFGAGSVVIGLPFLSEMGRSGGFAQPEAPPVRAFNCSFGLGLFEDMQRADLSGPLEPLRPLADRLLILKGVNYRLGNHGTDVSAPGGGVPNSHLETTTFTGTKVQDDLNRAGGASLDQALRRHAYPDGLPAGMLSTVQTGLAYEIGHNARDNRSWNPDGSPASRFTHRADELFEQLFGTFMSTSPSARSDAEVRACRRRRSVLDAVVSQYRHLSGERSNLGAASRYKLGLHLERIREVERRVFAADCEETEMPQFCVVPGSPSDFIDSEGAEYHDVSVRDMERTWRLLVDLYALGIQCDQFRFGSMVFLAQGARIRLSGDYEFEGRRVYSFDDERDWDAVDGRENKTSHEFWHSYGMSGTRGDTVRTAARAHAHFMVRQCAYFAEALDDPEYIDVNGKTIFENAMVTFATEAGSGNHNRATSNEVELANVFHAISPAAGRFRTGHVDLGLTDAVAVYNTMLEAHGVDVLLGSGASGVDEVLAS